MKQITTALGTAVLVGLAACGGSDTGDAPASAPGTTPAPAAAPAGGGALTTPDWYEVDHSAQTVRVHLIAGQTPTANYWNFNGYINGQATVVVPEGYTVTLELENRDPAMAHSVGVDRRTSGFPASFTSVEPVFAGAVTENPTSQMESTLPGETESITFVADAAGEYALVCYVPGHAAVGMWIHFHVSSSGDAGVRT